MLKDTEPNYVEKIYLEISALGFVLAVDDITSYENASDYEEGNYANLLLKLSAWDIGAGRIVIENPDAIIEEKIYFD
ncbi:MAG: hypothetical protein JEZ04_18255 [Spirochaetales bacterium]|nr:hypothetical protein [Spirochaetales bacterium]